MTYTSHLHTAMADDGYAPVQARHVRLLRLDRPANEQRPDSVVRRGIELPSQERA